jgi:hypothetical protein
MCLNFLYLAIFLKFNLHFNMFYHAHAYMLDMDDCFGMHTYRNLRLGEEVATYPITFSYSLSS